MRSETTSSDSSIESTLTAIVPPTRPLARGAKLAVYLACVGLAAIAAVSPTTGAPTATSSDMNAGRGIDGRWTATASPWLHAFAAPQIVHPPTPQATILGGVARFTVIASGTPPLTYQWRKGVKDLTDGGNVSGATTDVLTIRDATDMDAAIYSVVVTNGSGSDTSGGAALTVARAQGGDVDFSFDPGSSLNGTVYAMTIQPDGKVVIGGDFTSVQGAARNRITRLNADGKTDHTFGNALSGANNTVHCLAVQFDGRVLIGGSFTTVNGTSRSRIARLNADGSLDTTFLNGPAGAGSEVLAIAVQPDGKVLVGGDFTTVNGASRNRIARLNTNGSLDTTFLNGLSGANVSVKSLAVQPDGKVLIGGDFTTVNGTGRGRIARLNADGSLDTTFLNGLSGASNTVYSLAAQPDGRVLIGGSFTTVNGTGRNRIARLNADGSLDTTFLSGLPGASNTVHSLAVQPDGRVLIGGFFTTVNGTGRNRIARLNANGSLDTTFLDGLAGVNNSISPLAVQPDGRVLIGGSFTTVNGTSRNSIARLNADGSLDTPFLNGPSGVNSSVLSLSVQPDGRVLIGGSFTTVNGTSRNGIARLNTNGYLDTTFLNGLSGASHPVLSLAVRPDSRVLIGGSFTTVNGTSRNRIARLNVDGSLDTTFLSGLSGPNNVVQSLALQSDGRVLIGGSFTTVNGTSRSRLARLNVDGSLDTAFLNGLSGASGTVKSIAVQPDGRVLIGGLFATVNGTSRSCLARLNVDGSLDTTFLNGLSGANADVLSIAVQPDGRVLIGGFFTMVNGTSRSRIARLNADGSLDTTFLNGLSGANSTVYALTVQPDGRILIGGQFLLVNGANRNFIARLNADGSLDTDFNDAHPGPNETVLFLAAQPDGRVLIGGQFTTVNGTFQNYIARLHGSAPIAPTITVEPLAQLSYDGCCAVFTVIATGTPLDYQWRKDGVDLVDGPGVSGANAGTLRLAGLTAAEEGDYSVVVSNVLGVETSIDAVLAVNTVPQCQVATCDPVLGCTLFYLADGTSCDLDDDRCATDDACLVGVCAAGGPAVCGDGNLCTDDSCDLGTGCVFTDNTAACDDINPCTDDDACSAGICSGTPITSDATCDGVDDDCDGTNDEDYVPTPTSCGVGECAASGSISCIAGAVVDSCLPGVPGAEICNHLDDDCDGTVDNGVTLARFYQDADGDRYGDPGGTIQACFAPFGYVANADDCDDTTATVRPGGLERCDGLRNDCLGVGWPALLDADEDGTEDACEVCVDGDGDGWGDPGALGNLCATDNCPAVPNPDQLDPDYDGLGTACDACPLDPLDDEDGDGVCGDGDNCPLVANADQSDVDGDGLGDACDGCPMVSTGNNDDLDRDGIPNACDPDVDGDSVPNESDIDDDGDGVPDDDGDGVFDACPHRVTVDCDDNCPFDRNPNQRDRDGDLMGDACDAEDDRAQGVRARRRDPEAMPAEDGALFGPGTASIYPLVWDREIGAVAYNVYAGDLAELRTGPYGGCYRNRIVTTYTTLDHAPAAGTGVFYLVTPVYEDREGTLGDRFHFSERPRIAACPQ